MQKRFNHYCLTEQLGSKPLRSVYLAHHVKDVSHKVLLKIFDAPCLALGQESERFRHQVEWIKQLRHAHVVPILDLGVEQGQPYVVSTYFASGSLRHHLDSLSLKRLSLPETLKILSQVGQALSYFHEHAYLHENIKPENIFFDEQGETLLADFRLSGFIDVKLLDYQSDPRSMCYMAPEQFAGSASEKSDQYALACLAYELITGQEPFSAQSFAMMWASHYAEVPAPLTDLVPGLPPLIDKVVFKAMAKNPSERYPNIAAFVLALESAALVSKSTITEPLSISGIDTPAANIRQPIVNTKSGTPVGTSLMGTEPLSISAIDTPAANIRQSLANTKSGVPLETSLVGTEPLSISAIDTPTANIRQSLANTKSGISIETSLVGSFEGSLANAPFSTSMAGISFVPSLVGAPFGTSMAGVPFGTSMVGNPFKTSMVSNPFSTNQEDDFLDMTLEDNPFEMMQVDTPLTTRLLEHWEHMHDGPAKSTNTLAGGLRSDALPHSFRNTKYSILAFRLEKPRKRLTCLHRFVQLRGDLGNLLRLSFSQDRSYSSWLEKSRKRLNRLHWFVQLRDYLGNLLRLSFSQDRSYSSLTVWLVLAMTITVLIGGLVSNTFLASHSSGRNSYHESQTIIDTKDIPIDTRLITQPATHNVTTPRE